MILGLDSAQISWGKKLQDQLIRTWEKMFSFSKCSSSCTKRKESVSMQNFPTVCKTFFLALFTWFHLSLQVYAVRLHTPQSLTIMEIPPLWIFEIFLSLYDRNKGSTLNLVTQDLYCLHSGWHTHSSWIFLFYSPFARLRWADKQENYINYCVFSLRGHILHCALQSCIRPALGFCSVRMLNVLLQWLHVCTPPHSSGSLPLFQQS